MTINLIYKLSFSHKFSP